MNTLDYAILIAYLMGVLALGAVFARRQRDEDEFFLAGRSMHWFPLGLSVMVTAFSAMNYTAFSGEVFGHGLYVVLCVPVFVLVAIPVIKIVMPFYHRMRLCSAYEYLEKRFDVRVRCLASGLFILWRTAWAATALFVPCKVMSHLTGVNLHLLIVLAGVIATAYTMAGGMRAVMWTDVLQFFVLFGGIVLGVAVAARSTPGGFSGMLRLSADAGLMKPFYPFDPAMLSPDPRIRITLWSALIGTFTAFLARYGADQVVVQRYFTARSLKTAQRGFHLNYISAITSLLLLALLGFAIHAHAATNGLLGSLGPRPLPYFSAFVRSLPAGLTGLLVAGLFAATMSSVDSGVNSCCAAFVTDFYDRFRDAGRPTGPRLMRLLTLALGAIVTGTALTVDQWGTLFQIAAKIINGLGSPLLALFLLGMFSRRANSLGMLLGGLLGTAWSVFVSCSIEGLALHYYAVVNLAGTLLACYLCSLIAGPMCGRSSPEQLSWMWRAQKSQTTG